MTRFPDPLSSGCLASFWSDLFLPDFAFCSPGRRPLFHGDPRSLTLSRESQRFLVFRLPFPFFSPAIQIPLSCQGFGAFSSFCHGLSTLRWFWIPAPPFLAEAVFPVWDGRLVLSTPSRAFSKRWARNRPCGSFLAEWRVSP